MGASARVAISLAYARFGLSLIPSGSECRLGLAPSASWRASICRFIKVDCPPLAIQEARRHHLASLLKPFDGSAAGYFFFSLRFALLVACCMEATNFGCAVVARHGAYIMSVAGKDISPPWVRRPASPPWIRKIGRQPYPKRRQTANLMGLHVPHQVVLPGRSCMPLVVGCWAVTGVRRLRANNWGPMEPMEGKPHAADSAICWRDGISIPAPLIPTR